MQYNLQDKTIIITGGNSGIGKAAAIRLARLGASVVLACRSKERGESAAEDVRRAADPVGEQQTGRYCDAPGVEVRANKNAYSKENQKRLWAVSAMLAGV